MRKINRNRKRETEIEKEKQRDGERGEEDTAECKGGWEGKSRKKQTQRRGTQKERDKREYGENTELWELYRYISRYTR